MFCVGVDIVVVCRVCITAYVVGCVVGVVVDDTCIVTHIVVVVAYAAVRVVAVS